jgi:hypothetical protein
MMLRSPLTTSVQADQSPARDPDGQVRARRTAEGVFGREGTCDLEFQLWLYYRLFGDWMRMRARGVILPRSLCDRQQITYKWRRRER